MESKIRNIVNIVRGLLVEHNILTKYLKYESKGFSEKLVVQKIVVYYILNI